MKNPLEKLMKRKTLTLEVKCKFCKEETNNAKTGICDKCQHALDHWEDLGDHMKPPEE